MEREHFIQATARALGLSPEAVRETMKTVPKYSDTDRSTTSAEEGVVSVQTSPRTTRAEQLIATVHAYPDTALAERITSEYCRITGSQELPPLASAESALFQAEQTFGEDPGGGAADELLNAFEQAVVREAYQEAVAELRRAEASGDATRIEEAQRRCTSLSVRMATFGN